MKPDRQRFTGLIASLLLLTTTTATIAQQASINDAKSKQILAAMGHSSTWGHPDEYGEYVGMQRYSAGNYKEAMRYFIIGARYADKLSQLSIGLMYLNGQGVEKDPITAFAWIAIAAERKYPGFISTRNKVWAQLDSDQRERAKQLVAELYTTYGDSVAKPRMVHALRHALADSTGTGLGYDLSGAVFTANTNSPPPNCGAATINGAPGKGCGDLYAAWRWDPKQYFQVRDAAWKGTVTVGELKREEKPSRHPDKSTATSTPKDH